MTYFVNIQTLELLLKLFVCAHIIDQCIGSIKNNVHALAIGEVLKEYVKLRGHCLQTTILYKHMI